MIMTTMTADEVEAHMKQDMKELRKQLLRVKREWTQYVDRHGGLGLIFSRTYHLYNAHTRQEYIVVMMWLPSTRRMDICTYLAVVKDARQTYYIRKKSSSDVQICAFTHHFFLRYAERMGMPTKDIDQIIRLYSERNQLEQNIYKDDWDHPTRSVYANRSGIMLAKVTPLHWCIYATFVSTQMLKDTQVDARNEVTDILQRAQGIYETTLSVGADVGDFEHILSQLTKHTSMAASEIYAKFWEYED